MIEFNNFSIISLQYWIKTVQTTTKQNKHFTNKNARINLHWGWDLTVNTIWSAINDIMIHFDVYMVTSMVTNSWSYSLTVRSYPQYRLVRTYYTTPSCAFSHSHYYSLWLRNISLTHCQSIKCHLNTATNFIANFSRLIRKYHTIPG